jgi:two-component system phosphate regulon response regulator PhoB
MPQDRAILIVDDEDDIRHLLDINLRREGFSTRLARDAGEALTAIRAELPALVILDLMLPDMSGMEVCRRLQGDPSTRDVPIIILSARGEEIDRVVGFEVGADDYVVKSDLSVRELVLRVRAVLRRRQSSEEPPTAEAVVVRVGDLAIDERAHRVTLAGTEVALTATEFRLLWILASRDGRVQTRGTLLEVVWGMPPDLNTRTVDTHVKRLREKLGDAAAYVETVRGVGYRFNRSAL